MTEKQLTDKLDDMSHILNEIVGRITVAAAHDPVVNTAHKLAIDLGIRFDDLINDLLGEGAESEF